ncbi:MAG: helix-turn-helix domain-containing protein [Actinobacteria bacterium]|nr:helix-turn-helix domain-containing protein [Actinomycetota bacterium]
MQKISRLAAQEVAVLRVLVNCQGRVVSRRELARLAGIADLNDRRCDSLLVAIRRHLGPESIRTVRSRGWMLVPVAVERAEVLLVA